MGHGVDPRSPSALVLIIRTSTPQMKTYQPWGGVLQILHGHPCTRSSTFAGRIVNTRLLHREVETTKTGRKLVIDGVALVAGAFRAPFPKFSQQPFRSVDLGAIYSLCRINGLLISGLTDSGIGREVSLALASRGAHALICADINLKAAFKTDEMSHSRNADHLPDYRVHALHADVTDENSVQRMAIQAQLLFGRIDYFVDTAGVNSTPSAGLHTLQSSQLNLAMYPTFVALLCSTLRIDSS
ncbi:hypothetical protein BDR22DRAFT_817057 [Usnea florida]